MNSAAKPLCYIGCPVWACDSWVGTLYSSSQRRKWLREYSSVFSTVEGNSTFYGQPNTDVVRRWAADTEAGFRFALKFPRTITHDKQLLDAGLETRLFLESLRILQEADRLGPSILQLPPWFSGQQFPQLENYLRSLPRDVPLSVEVRHLDYFNHEPAEDRLTELLADLSVERVVFDSRALFSTTPADEHERASQKRKPNLPVRPIAIGEFPVVRFVGRNCVGETQPWIEEWVPVVAEWIQRGKTPYIFTHSPDDHYAPEFAKAFHAALTATVPNLPALPEAWPGELVKRQQSLF